MTDEQQPMDVFSWNDSNPLVQDLPPRLDLLGWGQALNSDPRTRWPDPLPVARYEAAAEQIEHCFVPTLEVMDAALNLESLLFRGLIQRDPREQVNRARIYETGRLKGKSIDALPWFPSNAAGATIKGITGMGKSHFIDRFLARYPQVIVRLKNDDAGWLELKQLGYLKIPMPADRSRGGFLLSAMLEIDKVLGTEYALTLKGRNPTVEKQLVLLLHILSVHRCGLLVIEEAQQQNIAVSPFGREFVTFFLRVLNFGIPLVIIGNPLAFTEIQRFSQDARRLSDGGSYSFEPVTTWEDDVWSKDLFPGIWNWNVFTQPDAEIVDVKKRIWEYTGGIPAMLARLRRETLRVAIRSKAQRVEEEHVKQAYQSHAMRGMHGLIQAFTLKRPSLLSAHSDIPREYFEEKWKAEAKAGALPKDPESDAAEKDTRTTPTGTAPATQAKASTARGKRSTKVATSGNDPEDRRGIAFQQALAARAVQNK